MVTTCLLDRPAAMCRSSEFESRSTGHATTARPGPSRPPEGETRPPFTPGPAQHPICLAWLEAAVARQGPEHPPGAPGGQEPVRLRAERSRELRPERGPGAADRTGTVRRETLDHVLT